MPSWVYYSTPINRYRDEKGRFTSQAELWRLSQKSIDSTTSEAREAALNLTPTELEDVLRQLIKGETIRQYVLGIGGKDRLTQVDYGVMGGVIADQYRYLTQAMAQYETGEISQAEVARRTAMYINSTREAFERANARARGLPNLEMYPGDGTSCRGLTSCGCHIEYHWRNGHWEVYWVLGTTEHCELCLDHAAEWSPLIIEA